ncbi:MAG: hypothetical protein J5J06_14450 [Phycisphaerae bacterium]|nr:hypothetical protein [Phycisphaerae bacterium]
MVNVTRGGKVRRAMLAVAVAMVGTTFASCTLGDLRNNVVAGILGFVEDYTADLLGEFVPAPGEFVGTAD